MLKELLTKSLAPNYQDAGMYLEDDDHILSLKVGKHVIARFNSHKATFDKVNQVADAWLNNICPSCGMSWDAVKEMLQDEPESDNVATAEFIMGNCSTCRHHIQQQTLVEVVVHALDKFSQGWRDCYGEQDILDWLVG